MNDSIEVPTDAVIIAGECDAHILNPNAFPTILQISHLIKESRQLGCGTGARCQRAWVVAVQVDFFCAQFLGYIRPEHQDHDICK